jgi:hypothetical protein
VQAARLRAQLQDVDVRGVVDPDRRLVEDLARLHDLRPVVPRDLALAELVAGIRARLAIKRWASSVTDISSEKSATGRRWSDRDVLRDVGDERALAHRRPRREHDQVRLLEARR